MVIEFSPHHIYLAGIVKCLSQREHALSFSDPNLCPKMHMVEMIEIITAIVTHVVTVESF